MEGDLQVNVFNILSRLLSVNEKVSWFAKLIKYDLNV